jgi:hypothetical protein
METQGLVGNQEPRRARQPPDRATVAASDEEPPTATRRGPADNGDRHRKQIDLWFL